MADSWGRALRVLGEAGIDPELLATVRPLSGGTYNSVEELRLTDGGRYVLKVAPTAPGLAYESRLLCAEAEFCRVAAEADVPAPRVLAQGGGADVPHLLLTACPGGPWNTSVRDAERDPLRAELGRLVARLHRMEGPGFGYPTEVFGPLVADWRTAFGAMYEALIEDAHRYGAWLPVPAADVARAARGAYGVLDEVAVARPVHFDLWDGNVLVDRVGDGTARVGGLIDGERMFWGDPLADFVSLALLGDITRDEAFLRGYREAGGEARFDAGARRRLALYRSYLYLIMLVETVPRAVGEDRGRWTRENVAPRLVAALDDLAHPAGRSRAS